MKLDLDKKALFKWANKNKDKVIGYPGYGDKTPISFFIANQNDSRPAIVTPNKIIVFLDDDVFKFEPSLELCKLVWFLATLRGFGQPIYGSDILNRMF